MPADVATVAVALEGLSRSEANLIFGAAGHLVHYEADTEPLRRLIELISDVLRGEASPEAAVLPGDEARLVGELPEALAEYDAQWLRETAFVVRYIGEDHTVDVQSDLTEDYMIASVPVSAVRPVR